VNFVWLERKVKEWGCMQALIDYDGWRKWKDFAAAKGDAADQPKASTGYSSYASRPKPTLSPVSPTSEQTRPLGINGVTSPKSPDGDKKNKRRSLGVGRPPALPEEESTVSLATEAEDS
jgi:osomolarity two-component system response regulator SSK1